MIPDNPADVKASATPHGIRPLVTCVRMNLAFGCLDASHLNQGERPYVPCSNGPSSSCRTRIRCFRDCIPAYLRFIENRGRHSASTLCACHSGVYGSVVTIAGNGTNRVPSLPQVV